MNSIYYHCFKNKDYWFQQVWVHVLCKVLCKFLQDRTKVMCSNAYDFFNIEILFESYILTTYQLYKQLQNKQKNVIHILFPTL